MNELYLLLGFCSLLIIFLLTFFGLIGPRKLREKMRKFNTWYYRDSALLFPLDPYKPIEEALKESAENFLPTKERMRNSLKIVWIIITITLIGIVASILFSSRL